MVSYGRLGLYQEKVGRHPCAEHDGWTLLMNAADPAFYEAQAVVLSRMEQHKQALEIYVFKMQDYEKAEKYAMAPLPLTGNIQD